MQTITIQQNSTGTFTIRINGFVYRSDHCNLTAKEAKERASAIKAEFAMLRQNAEIVVSE